MNLLIYCVCFFLFRKGKSLNLKYFEVNQTKEEASANLNFVQVSIAERWRGEDKAQHGNIPEVT